MIRIIEGLWSTSFFADAGFDIPFKVEFCEICRSYGLNKFYLYIIERLRKAGLLPYDYKKICCTCFIIKEKMGGNYHKGCRLPLKMRPSSNWSVDIICTECNVRVGDISEVDGELVGEIYEEVEET